ncbi:MAG: right-handed parallel beta-helix repeat-containing protein, partial [Mycobacterium sp.]|nr:right-handed parallel beta-helix repeat-containing protein [Mycobacterium sp.]
VQALGGGGTYPVSGLPVLEWFAFAPNYYAQNGEDPKKQIGDYPYPQCATQCLPSLIDSGAPSTSVRLKGGDGDPYNDNGQLQTGVDFIAEFPTTRGRPPLTWTFTAGDTGSVDEVNYVPGALIDGPGQNVNTGLNLYNAFDVMFDVKEQVIWLRPTGNTAMVSLQSVTTTGDQTYRQSATLGGTYSTGGGSFSVAGLTTLGSDTVVNAGGGDVRFSGTVDGANSLTVNSSGTTEFVRGVGYVTELTELGTDAGGSTSSSGIRTSGAQTYNDVATLNGQYKVNDGTFTAAADTTLAGPVSIEASKGDITFAGAVDALPGKGFSLSLTTGAGHRVAFNKDIGATHPLGGLAVTNSSGTPQNPVTFTVPGKITLVGNLGFTAAQGISVSDDVTTTLTGGGQIQFFSHEGISLGASSGSEVSGFIVSNNGGQGIAVTGADNLSLTDNAIINNGKNGIIATSGSMTVSGSSITGNTFNGIEVDGVENVTITNTTISGNGAGANGTKYNGVLLTDSSKVSISNTTVSGNAGDGILSSTSDDVELKQNVISGNAAKGIVVDGGTGNAIESNSIYLNGTTTDDGIALQNGGNDNQKAPVIAKAKFNNGYIEVSGNQPDSAGESYRVQVFYSLTPPAGLPVQGQQYLGDLAVKPDGSFSGQFASPQPSAGNYITATATPATGPKNTSSFSDAVEVDA